MTAAIVKPACYNKILNSNAPFGKKILFWLAYRVVIEKNKTYSVIAKIFLKKSETFKSFSEKLTHEKIKFESKKNVDTVPSSQDTSSVALKSPTFSPNGQTPWTKKTEQGFTIDNGQLETTEGFGAYLDFCLRPNTRNFDNGGGSYNFNSEFLKHYHGVTNVVYDPFQRPEEENKKVLAELDKHNFDTATSNSVLNVIDNKQARLKHIALSCQALKEGGTAYFKVYPGNKSGKEEWMHHGYQSNRFAETYQPEVEEIFGVGNVVTCKEKNMIVAYKNTGCKN